MSNMKHVLVFILHCIFSQTISGLRMVEVKVPIYRMLGDPALLQCNYDLGNDSLYSVKWYKEHEEFYRFVPKATPQATSYAVEGVNVDMSKSDSKNVKLNAVTWKSSGVYRCEVSAEAPSFTSAQSEGRMEIIAFPNEDPTITGTNMQYQIGDELFLNCTSGKSHPPSTLHWYINEQQVVSPEVLVNYPPIYHQEGSYSTILGLKFTLSDRHFHGGSMKLKCVASLSPIWHHGGVQSLPIKDMKKASLLVMSSSTMHLCSTTDYFIIASFIILQMKI